MNTSLHLLVLSADADHPGVQLFADGRGQALAAPADAGPSPRRILVVPACDVVLHWSPVKAATPAQARAAAWHQLANQLSEPRQGLRMALGDGDEARWVAVFTEAARERWLARAAAQGFQPDVIVPDCLLLPEVSAGDPPAVAADDRLVRARGHDFAFSAEAGLAAHVLGPASVQAPADPGHLHRRLLQGAAGPAPLDLSPAPEAARGHQTVPTRRLVTLAAAVLLAPLLILAAQATRHEIGASRALARADHALAAVAPAATGPARPLARARAELARRMAPDRFGVMASALVEAQSEVPGTQLLSLTLDADGVMGARLAYGQTGQIDQMRDALARRGIALSEQDSEPAPAGWTTTLLLSDAR